MRGALGGTAAADARRLLPQGCVGKRLQRLVQGRKLVCDADETLSGLEAAVDGVHLVAEPVEALENRVKLTVVQVFPLHRL
jgi:hypothetical protein